jgi:hypothetical protein
MATDITDPQWLPEPTHRWKRRPNLQFLLFSVIWILLQLPFISSAYRIDEPKILSISDQIQHSPLDPYGFEVDWSGRPRLAFSVYANPPLVPAWLSLWRTCLPDSETSCHLAMLIFSLLALHAFFVLAGHFKLDPLISILLLCCSPSFFLASQVIMPDTAMLALFLLSVAYALSYEQEGRRHQLIISFISGFLAPIAKYNAMVLFPLLLWLFLISRRKPAMSAIAAAPLASFALWNFLAFLRYGATHFSVISAFEKDLAHPPLILASGVICAIGLGVFPLSAIAFSPGISRQLVSIWLVLLIIFAASYSVARGIDYNPISAVLFALAVSIFCYVIILAIGQISKCFRDRDCRTALLVIWIFVGLAFQGGLMFTSVRYVLFLAPPIILLVLKQAVPRKTQFVHWFLIGAALAFVFALAIGDRMIADAYRRVINGPIAQLRSAFNGKLYYTGEWGLEYYAKKIGAVPLRSKNVLSPNFSDGDLILVPTTAWPGVTEPPLKIGQKVEKAAFVYNPPWILRTIDCNAAANFYGTAISHCPRPTFLPWGYARDPSEKFVVYSIHD